MEQFITDPGVYLPLIGGTLIPFVVALLTKLKASIGVKGAVAAVAAGLTAVGIYVSDLAHEFSWKGVATAFVLALSAAAFTRVTVTGGQDDKVAAATKDFGVG